MVEKKSTVRLMLKYAILESASKLLFQPKLSEQENSHV